MFNFFREIVPNPSSTEMIIGSTVSLFGTVFSYLIGGYDMMFQTLIVVIILDYITGVMAAWCEKSDIKKKPSSRRGLKGIVKKVFILSLVVLAHLIDEVSGGGNLARTMTIWFFFANEGLSIIENAARIGLPVPQVIKNKLAQLAEEKVVK